MTSRSIVVVHAHPDDETLFTGGLTSLAAARGWHLTLVTCTDGRFGIDPSGRPGTHPNHDPAATAALRASELQKAAALVGIGRCVALGFRDSGMAGWEQNEHPEAFAQSDIDLVGERVAAVLDEVNADVVVTYDPHGYYGHPDHIHTHRVTRAALEHAGRVRQLWYPVTPTRALDIFRPAARDAGVRLPAWVHDAGAGVSDAEVDFTPDTVPFAAAKHAALAAHASQIDNADLLTMPADLFTLLLGQEYYQCAMTRDGAPSTHIEGLE